MRFRARKISLQGFQDAAHVADGARRGRRAVGHVVEGLDRHVAAIAVLFQRAEKAGEALLALAGALAVAVVDLHWAITPLGSQRSASAASGSFSMRPAELQSSMLRTAGEL